MSSSKIAQYTARKNAAVQAGGESVRNIHRGTSGILVRYTEAHELYQDAEAKLEYYRVVYRGGLVLMGIGVVLGLGAVLRRFFVPELPDRYELVGR